MEGEISEQEFAKVAAADAGAKSLQSCPTLVLIVAPQPG